MLGAEETTFESKPSSINSASSAKVVGITCTLKALAPVHEKVQFAKRKRKNEFLAPPRCGARDGLKD